MIFRLLKQLRKVWWDVPSRYECPNCGEARFSMLDGKNRQGLVDKFRFWYG